MKKTILIDIIMSLEYLKKVELYDLLEEFKLNTNNKEQIAYDVNDLAFLHQHILSTKPFTILEFGVGFSSIVIAHALKINRKKFSQLEKPQLRNSKLFFHYIVDANKFWIDNTKKYFPVELAEDIHFHYSACKIGIYNGQLSSYYENLPDIVPDFIYLDGPDPKDVQGTINGLSFNCAERTVMSSDLLLMESTFLPGTSILIDGRTNNSRFLLRNFQRSYIHQWDAKNDRTIFILDEERLGKYNILGNDIY